MEQIDITELMKQAPESKSLQILPYLDHIMYLRNRGYLFRQISPIFGMKQSTFRYNLKKATAISHDRPDLPTGYKIPNKIIDGIQSGDIDQSLLRNIGGFTESDRHQKIVDSSDHEEEKALVNEEKEANNQPDHDKHEQSLEDYRDEVLRLSRPSKFQHRFNIDLEHK